MENKNNGNPRIMGESYVRHLSDTAMSKMFYQARMDKHKVISCIIERKNVPQINEEIDFLCLPQLRRTGLLLVLERHTNQVKALPRMAIIKHKIKITVATIRSRSFITRPTILVLCIGEKDDA
jgi:hypothetical protein